MSQNTLVIVDGTGLEVLGYLNDAFNTIVTSNSGATAPSTTYAGMFWLDTSGANPVLKIRNGNNTGWMTAFTIDVNKQLASKTTETGSVVVSSGTQSQRDVSPAAGYFRFNTETTKFEGYNGTAWGSVGGGATGGGSDEVFIENGQTVNVNYAIPSGKNAGTFGPVSVASGITVTIPSGSTWAVV